MKAPKSSEVNTHLALVRFITRFVDHVNNLETRIEQLEKGAKKLQRQQVGLSKQLTIQTTSLTARIGQLLKPKVKAAASVETETETKETKNEK